MIKHFPIQYDATGNLNEQANISQWDAIIGFWYYSKYLTFYSASDGQTETDYRFSHKQNAGLFHRIRAFIFW